MEVFDHKLSIVLRARKSWPKYASFEEDSILRKEKWNDKYTSERVIQWDNTNVTMTKPSDAALQRTTYSQYYKENCAKGGVHLQFCGWMGTEELWTGNVCDSDYQSNGNIIMEQKVFACNDRKEKEDINPFYMLLDKGYRITELAFREGYGQITMQPDFAKADEKFKRHQVLTSSTVASDRSGNERAVRLSKQCGLINRGMHPRTSFVRIDNEWLVWSFQCNFMYKNVN